MRINENFTKTLEKALNSIHELQETIESIEDSKLISKISEKANQTERIIEYSFLLSLIILDIATAIRINYNSKGEYETNYAAKQLIITSLEGFKKIYHFILKNKHGDTISNYRNNSFWIKDIKTVICNDHQYLLNEFELISLELDSFMENNMVNLKSNRDLFIHYDWNPSKVYIELHKLDIENIVKNILPFYGIITRMIKVVDIIIVKNDSMFKEYFKEYNS